MGTPELAFVTAQGETRTLKEFEGKVVLVVNVASKCGLTPQYRALEDLYRELQPQGLEILAFPCNQFGGQEPGNDGEIQEFCSTNFDVTFPVLAKIDVNGPQAHPLYVHLRSEAPGNFGPENPLYKHIASTNPQALETDEVKWNFTKFLVGRDGAVIDRFEPTVTPEELRPAILATLDS